MDSIVNTKSKVKSKNKEKVKKKRKNRSFNIFVRVSLVVIFAAIIVYIVNSAIYIAVNLSIYNKIKNENEITLKPLCNHTFICKYNINTIKQKDIEVSVVQNDMKAILNNENLKRVMKFDLQGEYVTVEENTAYDVSLSNDTTISAIKEINVSIDKNRINSDIVDVYTNDMSEKLETLNLEENKLYITKVDGVSSYRVIYIPVKDIIISESSIKINKNDSKNLSITVLPENATNKELAIKSDDNNIATMSTTGVLNGVNAGKTNIIVGVNNEAVTKSLEVEVVPILEDISVSKTSISMYVGANTTVTAKAKPDNAVNGTLNWTSSDEKIAKVENGKITGVKAGKCVVTVKNSDGNIIEKKINITVKDKPVVSSGGQTSSNGLTYVKGVLVVNKKYSVPETYNPGVNAEAYKALQNLQAAAKAEGYSLPLRSGFRSYNTQKTLYNSYVKRYGQAATDTFSAKPGHSEHQTGLAFDVGAVDDNFGNTPAGQWLAQNCHTYGFIIRYPKGKQSITGYKYEPWHIRYLGVSTATSVYNSGLCLEEYLGI